MRDIGPPYHLLALPWYGSNKDGQCYKDEPEHAFELAIIVHIFFANSIAHMY